eukprot:s122_g12.t1
MEAVFEALAPMTKCRCQAAQNAQSSLVNLIKARDFLKLFKTPLTLGKADCFKPVAAGKPLDLVAFLLPNCRDKSKQPAQKRKEGATKSRPLRHGIENRRPKAEEER